MKIDPALVDAVLEPGDHRARGDRAAPARAGWAWPATASSSEDRVETPYLQLVMTRLWQEETAAGLA